MSTILTFAACDTRRCVDVSIINDAVDEPDEMFGITLERTPGLNDRITLDPVDGVVIIIDDDGRFNPDKNSLQNTFLPSWETNLTFK